MNPVPLWQRFRGSLAGRLFAGAAIAASFGALAAAEVSPAPAAVILSALGGALLGVVGVGLLEQRDRRRARTAEWQLRVADTAERIRAEYPLIPPEQAPDLAQAVEENRFTLITWLGMIFGGLSALCGVVMLITRIVQFFRSP